MIGMYSEIATTSKDREMKIECCDPVSTENIILSQPFLILLAVHPFIRAVRNGRGHVAAFTIMLRENVLILKFNSHITSIKIAFY